jgi:hypothetical protein
MKISSPAFENAGEIPSKYTCDGEDINPELNIEDVPEDTKSLVLIMDDPDAVKPAGKVWDHWVVFNIPKDVRKIEEGKEPEGIPGKNSWGRLGYGGPCPPDTRHRYFFKVYALDIELHLEEGATKQEVEEAMKDHILDKAELIVTYERKK